MPSRIVSVAILFYWLIAAMRLVTRDLLPELSVGHPPDLRTIASAGGESRPARWSVQVVDNPNSPEGRRTVGQAVTESRRARDGWVEMTSKVSFDSRRLLGSILKGAAYPPGGPKADEQVEFVSTYHVDPSGNLQEFHGEVRAAAQPGALWRIDGRLKKNQMMEVVSQGPLPFLNKTLTFDYHDRGVVQSQFGPLDRLPGLQVGQRWDERVASPLTNQVETVRAAVERKTVIHWDQGPVATFEVVHHSKAASARTWVRPDGLVLRQEVALPMLRVVLDRIPEPTPGGDAAGPTR
jgi:hypothetical protein